MPKGFESVLISLGYFLESPFSRVVARSIILLGKPALAAHVESRHQITDKDGVCLCQKPTPSMPCYVCLLEVRMHRFFFVVLDLRISSIISATRKYQRIQKLRSCLLYCFPPNWSEEVQVFV